ncbi:MAG TPA: cupin domain-containing protein [Pyrinomonadaceae bacterium]|nr:cupin domain-containing protein [Pyrinomonadaceae bacterium]
MSDFDFDTLISPTTQDQFFSEHWETKPLLIQRHQHDYYSSLLQGSDIDYLLSVASSLEGENVELLGNTKPLSKSERKMASAFYRAYREGSSLRIRGVNRLWKPIWTLCIRIQELFGFRVSANLYISPADSHGLDRHYDLHDTIVLQIAGTKNWKVSGSAVALPLEHTPLMQFERSGQDLRYRGGQLVQDVVEKYSETEPPLEFVLEPGDLLYMPRGYVHQAWTTNELSSHVTIGIYPTTWVDLISVALGQAGHRDVKYRKALPVGFTQRSSDGSIGEEFKTLLRALAEEANVSQAVEELNASLIWNQQTIAEGLIASKNSDSITAETILERRPGFVCRFVLDGDFVRLAASHGELSMPRFFEASIRFVSENQSFVVGAIPGGMSERSKINLAQRLVDDGFMRVAKQR